MRVTFFAYQVFDGHQIPMRTEDYIDEALMQKLILDRFTVNSGVLHSLFDRPN